MALSDPGHRVQKLEGVLSASPGHTKDTLPSECGCGSQVHLLNPNLREGIGRSSRVLMKEAAEGACPSAVSSQKLHPTVAPTPHLRPQDLGPAASTTVRNRCWPFMSQQLRDTLPRKR